MAAQLYYEDVEVGIEMTPLVKHPTNAQLFAFSAVTRNVHRIHYDKDFAQSEGHPDVLIHGPLQGAFLSQFIMDWIGRGGTFKKLSYQNRARAVLGDTLTCRGTVTNKYVRDGNHYVECEIRTENQRGEVCAPGRATVILPSKVG